MSLGFATFAHAQASIWHAPCSFSRMDIARPKLKQRKRRRQYVIGACIAALLLVAVAGLSALGPAIPSIERSSVLVDSVKRGELLREVRGPGTLVPKEIRWIAAETAA